MHRIRILIADDHALVRSGLRALLSTQPDLEVIGEAADGARVLQQCQRLRPDVVLLDLSMPERGGTAAIRDLQGECPETKVLVVTMHAGEGHVRQALLAGANGYVPKQSLTTDLTAAIRAVHRGEQYLAPWLASPAVASQPSAARAHSQPGALDRLTEREREVMMLVALGHTNLEVSRQLHISTKTVETHRKNIMVKLDFQSRAELVRFTLEHGLIEV